MTYEVEQEVTLHPEDGVNPTFTLRLAAASGSLAEIDRVVYTLDPIFPNPVRMARDRTKRFGITFQSWGTFVVKIRVIGKSGQETLLEHTLTALDEQSRPLGDLLALPAGPRAEALLTLAKRFQDQKAFGVASRLLEAALAETSSDSVSAIKARIVQQLALCTYKDSSRPADCRLDAALKILRKNWPQLDGCGDAETLGLAGAIYKRKWEVDGQRTHLERSLAFYRLGYEAGKTMAVADENFECGAYPGINAAFLLDLLASEEERAALAAGSSTVSPRREEAKQIRLRIHDDLTKLFETNPKRRNWWRVATQIEALVGRDEFVEAAKLADLLPSLGVKDWQLESTCTQLAALIRLRANPATTFEELKQSGGWAVLEKLAGGSGEAVSRAFVGKIGLALSGGGFRASLFHIGVLARLAERGILRHIEVLSCVSGGSIIGAHYYLALRHHLENHSDSVSDQPYVAMIQQIERDFLAGVQKNIRTRLAGHLPSNARMILQPDKYSRTERLGELYEKEIYSRIQDGAAEADRWLNDLFIQPARNTGSGGLEVDDEFSPNLHNWKRQAKVPILILNATSLNTGHAWQFSASWMGEPAGAINSAIDANDRLRRVYYANAPAPHHKLRLGTAVAASSCVPGLFDPIVLDKLYQDRTVRLVDGGVHDNQGIQSLLDQDCTLLLVSDASGQSESLDNPSKGTLGVLLRTNGILQARVRTTQYEDLAARKRAGLLKGLMFVHLKKGLELEDVSASGSSDRLAELCPPGSSASRDPTDYGITVAAQQRLAAIRTDLDSFTDLEAFALMTSGYRMTERELEKLNWPGHADMRAEWNFLAIEDSISGAKSADPTAAEVLRQLDASSKLAFKVWGLITPLRYLAGALLGAAVLGVIVFLCLSWNQPLFPAYTVGWLVIVLLTGAAFTFAEMVVGKRALSMVRYRETLARFVKGIALAAVGWLFAWIHILVFDRLYLSQGKIGKPARTAKPLPPASN